MTIPIVDLIAKAKTRLLDLVAAKAPPPSAPVIPVQKPNDQRLSKTVMPNAARARAQVDPFQAAAGSVSKSVAMPSLAVPNDPTPKTQPIKVITADPVAERTISLQLSEIIDGLPNESIKPADAFDSNRAIILKASDLERGMANGKPTVSLTSIYQQAPEIFSTAIQPDDHTPIPLPFGKVLEEFNRLQVRPDQEHDADVPQLETPFLKVTLEDTKRFGTEMEALRTSQLPPVKIEPATAKTIADAEPEPVAKS